MTSEFINMLCKTLRSHGYFEDFNIYVSSDKFLFITGTSAPIFYISARDSCIRALGIGVLEDTKLEFHNPLLIEKIIEYIKKHE